MRRRIASLRQRLAGAQSKATRDTARDLAEERLSIARGHVTDHQELLATRAFRAAIAADPGWGVPAVEYARYLISRSNATVAEDVLATTLSVNGANPDAVELYIEAVHALDRVGGHQKWALARLEADLGLHTDAHRGSLDFVVSQKLTAAAETLRHSPDAVSRAVVRLDAALESGDIDDSTVSAITDGLPQKEADRALAITLLGRSKTSKALEILGGMDSTAVPMNSLRRAIRRALQRNKLDQARKYLEIYLKLRPQDGWASRTLGDLGDKQFSNYRLGKQGFPLPKLASKPAYEAEADRIFYLLHNSLPHNSAGYATRTHGLLRALNESGWDVDGVTRLGYPYDMPGKSDIDDVEPQEAIDGVDYIRLLQGREIEKKNPLYFYVQRYSAALEARARADRPAIIHAASNHWNGLTAVVTARKLGIPSIYEVRGLWEVTRGSRNPEWAKGNMYKYIARMEADAAKAATRVFTITNALRDEMIARGVDGDKITVLPNGVDSSRFTPVPRDEDLAQELGVSGKTVIGYIGSILDYEGLELLIAAAKELAQTRSDFHVLFVGDGAELDKFRSQVQADGLEHVITFTGRVPHADVERYYSLVDIAPFPRLPLPVCEMVSPLKPFEAMAMGKAVVASDVAALAEIVTPGENGLLHAKGDARSLQAQLTTLLDSPELTKRLGEQARSWVVENRDWNQIATTVSDAYSELTRPQ